MKINLLMFYQDDPKKCTAAKLIKFGLARKITKSQSKTVLLHPYAKKTLLNKEKSLFTSITGIDCSWALAEEVFQKNFVGAARKLPPLLAGNPVNYSKINIDNWNVEILKDEQPSRFYYKVSYVALE